MKACPSCGAELGEADTKCPICDFQLPVAASLEMKVEVPEKEVTGLLDDVKARIQRLAGARSETETENKQEIPETAIIEEPEADEIVSVDEAADEESHSEARAEQEGSLTITSRPGRGDFVLPGMETETKKPMKELDKVGFKVKAEFSHEKGRKRLTITVASIAIVAMIVLTYFFVILPNLTNIRPAVDGVFDDWSKTVKYESYVKSDNSEMDFKECAVQMDGEILFWYFSTNGDLFSASTQISPIISSYSLFIDADGNPVTGFSLDQWFGADEVVVIAGNGGKNSSLTKLYEFYGQDRNNWSSWRALDSISLSIMGKQVEASFRTPLYFNSTCARYIAFSYDGMSTPSATLPFSLTPGILLVRQTPYVDTNGIIWSGIKRPILKVTLSSYGGHLPIEEIRPTVANLPSYKLDIGKWNNSQSDQSLDVIFNATTTALASGTYIEASILPSNVVSDYRSVVIMGDPTVGYLSSIPAGITIDGIFSDWKSFNTDFNELSMPGNIDIDRISNSTGASNSYFYIDVLGEMMKGEQIPAKETVPSPTVSSNPWTSERVTGEDVIRIYFDINPGADKGAPSPLNGTDIRPELMIEIGGRNGVITEKNLMTWNNGWEADHLKIMNTCIGDRTIEIGVTVDLTHAKYLIVFSDWMGNQDIVTGSL